jgi:methionyl aminopeptidase
MLRPGITGKVIDREAETLIRDHGAIPAFKGYRGFPATLCVSVNEVVVHGIPNDAQVFKSGDVVSVDCGVQMNGFFGDAAYTFALGEVPEETMALLRATHDSLYKGIDQVAIGNRLGDVSFAVQDFIERKHGYAIVRELVGHGLGRSLHEAPDVPNFGKRGKGPLLMEGLVIAIEPMVNLGKRDVRTKRDGWTVYAKDMQPSAHYEHSVAVRKSGVDILSDHKPIVAEIRKNPNIKELFPAAVLT